MGYFIYVYIYWMVLAALFTLVFLPFFFLHWSDHGIFATIHWLVRIAIFLSYFILGPWIARSAAKRRAEFGQGFFTALSGAFGEFRLGLSMLPIIGFWFQNQANSISPDDSSPIE